MIATVRHTSSAPRARKENGPYNGAGMHHASIEPFVDLACEPHVRGLLHRPFDPNGDVLVLAHSAGANSQSPLLVAVAEALYSTEQSGQVHRVWPFSFSNGVGQEPETNTLLF